MLAHKYIPTRLISSAERPKIPVIPPKKPSWLRSVCLRLEVLRELFHFLWFTKIQKRKMEEDALRARAFWHKTGAAWIKAGQLLSLRSDLFPTEICQVLKSFQDVGPGVPFEFVRHTLEHELRRPLHAAFEHFVEQPFLATSVAQLHRAYLRQERVWVVVKIQKPYVQQMFTRDMRIIRRFFWLLHVLSVYPNMRWGDFCTQLEDLMTKELDFRYEVSSLRRLKKTLRKHDVYVPETFSQYSSRRVLVMEFIHGALMTDFIALQQTDPARLQNWLQENHITPKRIAHRLFESVYRQMFEDNLFHGDMHPGNVVLLRHNRLAILDCRSVGSLEGELLDKYRRFLFALTSDQYETAADLYFLLAISLPDVEMNIVKSKLIRAWRVWQTKSHIKEMPYHEKSITTMFDQVNEIVFQYDFTIQWPLSKLTRAWANLDASLTHLRPEMNYLAFLRRYFEQANGRRRKKAMRRIPTRIPSSISATQELPDQYSEYALFQQAVLRRQVQVFQGKTSTSGAVIGMLLGAAGMVVLFLEGAALSALLHQWLHLPIQQVLGPQLAARIADAPTLHWGGWIGLLASGMYLLTLIRTIKSRLEKVEAVLPGLQSSV